MKLDLFISTVGKERVKLDEKLIHHTFSKSGGEAEALMVATTQGELVKTLDLAHELKIPVFIIGNGTKVILSFKIKGLVLKNKTPALKMAGFKGKISQRGMGIEEAYIEADSGVSLDRLNEFAKSQKLQEIAGISSLHSSVGGSIFLDPLLRSATLSLKVWEDGEVEEIKLDHLKKKQIVLSVIFKFKARSA